MAIATYYFGVKIYNQLSHWSNQNLQLKFDHYVYFQQYFFNALLNYNLNIRNN